MANFYTACKQAQKAGFTHILGSDGKVTELPKSKCIPANLPRQGWFFAYNGRQILFVTRKGSAKFLGFYDLVKIETEPTPTA